MVTKSQKGPNEDDGDSTDRPLLSLRSAVIFIGALFGATVLGGLTYLLLYSVALALIVTFVAFGFLTVFGTKVIH